MVPKGLGLPWREGNAYPFSSHRWWAAALTPSLAEARMHAALDDSSLVGLRGQPHEQTALLTSPRVGEHPPARKHPPSCTAQPARGLPACCFSTCLITKQRLQPGLLYFYM